MALVYSYTPLSKLFIDIALAHREMRFHILYFIALDLRLTIRPSVVRGFLL